MTLVTVVWSASCGGQKGGGSLNNNGGGDDGGSSGNCQGFSCSGSGSSSGDLGSQGDDGGFASSDSGVPVVMSQNGPVNDSACPGPLTAANVTALKSATANSAGMKWLYPYDGTIFPGGLASPVLQWSQSGTPDGVYLHLHSAKYDFVGCFKGSSTLQLKIDEKEWATAYAQSGGASDPLTAQFATISGGTVSGFITETWTFAKGNLAGVVYYNTYGSKLVPGQTTQNGAVMKITPGQADPTAFLYTTGPSLFPFGPCVSCHSLSSDGSTLVAQQHFYPGSDPLNGKGSMSFTLTATAKPDPTAPQASTLNDDWGFSALTPDGKTLLTSGEPADTTATPLFPGAAFNNPGMIGPKDSLLYNTKTGTTTMPTGLTSPYAMMPMFSPDGKHIVYTEAPAGDAGAGGHSIVTMDFDGVHTFSNPKRIFTDNTKFPGWPFFTPDSAQIIFALGNANNFASETPPAVIPVNASELYVVPAAGGTAHRLDLLSGFKNGSVYLPNGSMDEALDFYPTVNPVSSGGYFWVYFTSRRAYGNLYNKGSGDGGSKSIWVAAIDIAPAPGADPSHPAFYLPGQELGSGNIRAFAVLPVCKADGAGCESGIDCCGGSCTTGKCGVPSTCAGEGDRCTDTVKCCNPADSCLGGYCGFIVK
jgi:hypothetical protein